jgi:hypothetical protein
MRNRTIFIAGFFLIAGTIFAGQVSAQRSWDREGARNNVRDLEENTDRFRRSLDRALDRRRVDGTITEDVINRYVRQFERATDRLRKNWNNERNGGQATREVLRRGRSIDVYMRSNRLGQEAESDWRDVRRNLDRLAVIYSVNWVW